MFVPLDALRAQSLIIKLSDGMRPHSRLCISLFCGITVLKGSSVTVLLERSRERASVLLTAKIQESPQKMRAHHPRPEISKCVEVKDPYQNASACKHF